MGNHTIKEKVCIAEFFPNTGFGLLLGQTLAPGLIGGMRELQKALTLGSILFRDKLRSLSVELRKPAAETYCHAHLERQ